MFKNVLLGLSAFGAMSAPIIGMVSCGSSKETNLEGNFDIGLELNYAPYNFLITKSQYDSVVKGHANYEAMVAPTTDGNYGGGLDVYVANQIAIVLNKKTLLHAHDWDSLIPSLTNKHLYDAIIAGMSDTPERREFVDFSDPYLQPSLGIIFKNTAPTTLDGKEIYVQAGTTHVEVVDNAISGTTATKHEVSEANLIGQEVKKPGDQIIGVVEDAAGTLLASQFGLQIQTSSSLLGTNTPEKISIGLPKGSSYLTEINKWIATFATEANTKLATASALANAILA